MRRSAGFARIVTPRCVLLMSVKRLDGRVDVQRPRLFQQRLIAGLEMLFQPRPAALSVQRLHRPANRVLAHDLRHAQQPRVHSVAPDSADVRIAPMPRQDGQQNCAQHIPFLWRVAAGVLQRTIRNPAVETSAHLQKFDKVRQQSKAAYCSLRHPAHLHLSSKCVQATHYTRRVETTFSRLTLRVNRNQAPVVSHSQQYQLLQPMTPQTTAVSRMKRLTPSSVDRVASSTDSSKACTASEFSS